jgi:hypothetical protein
MITEIELDRDAITFMRSCLSEGNTLSKHLLRLPLDEGRVVTYLPLTASPDAIKRFAVGGIIPTTRLQHEVDAGKYEFVQLSRAEVELKLADLISAYLNQPGSRYAIFEHALAEPTDPWLAQTSAKFFTYRSEVYIFLTSQDISTKAIVSAIRTAATYRFTGILCTTSKLPDLGTGQVVEQDTLRALAKSTEHIIVGAYDGESEIVWSRPRPNIAD